MRLSRCRRQVRPSTSTHGAGRHPAPHDHWRGRLLEDAIGRVLALMIGVTADGLLALALRVFPAFSQASLIRGRAAGKKQETYRALPITYSLPPVTS